MRDHTTSRTTIAIREARPAEAPRLTELAHASKRHWGYGEDLIAIWTDDLTITPAFIEAHRVHAAVVEGDVAGFYAVSRDGSVVELEHMWVDPGWIGRGIGRALFSHAIETARTLGGSLLRIASDPNAEGFYLTMGATRVGSVASAPNGRQLPTLELAVGEPR